MELCYRDKGQQGEEVIPVDAPKKVQKVKQLAQLKAQSAATAREMGKSVLPTRQEIDTEKGISIDMPTHNQPLRKKGPRFEETHVRFTNYMQKDLFAAVQALKRAGEIEI